MIEKRGKVTGKGKCDDEFIQDADVEIDGKKGKFYIDDDNVGNVDYDEKYKITFDDGSEITVQPAKGNLSEIEPCSIDFDII